MGSEAIYTLRPLLTTREAVLLLNVHVNTVRRWSERGTLRAYRVGIARQRRFRSEDVAALLMEQTKRYRLNASKLSRQ